MGCERKTRDEREDAHAVRALLPESLRHYDEPLVSRARE